MKRILVLMLSALLLLSLCACGEKKGEEAPVDLAAAAQKAVSGLDSEAAPLLQETNEEMLYALYPGLRDISLKQWVLYAHPVTGAPCEVLMIEVAAADVGAAQSALQARIDTAADDTLYPDNAEGWKNNARVSVNGSYLVMAVLPDGVERPAAFDAIFTA